MEADPVELETELAYFIAGLHRRLDEREPWRRDALCREPAYRPARFFPERGEPVTPAVAVCARCLVRGECLAAALADVHAVSVGVWGGTSARERRRLGVGVARTGAIDVRAARDRCPQGHELREYRDPRGWIQRRCLTCESAKRRLSRATTSAA